MKCIVSDTYREKPMKGKYMKTIPKISLFVLALTCFRLIPNAQAVMPPPDGGYPGGNTAEGQDALLHLTTGVHNAAVGFFSLKTDTTGSYNTAIGSGTLRANNSDGNTATGTFALLSNIIGRLNTANGALALLSALVAVAPGVAGVGSSCPSGRGSSVMESSHQKSTKPRRSRTGVVARSGDHAPTGVPPTCSAVAKSG